MIYFVQQQFLMSFQRLPLFRLCLAYKIHVPCVCTFKGFIISKFFSHFIHHTNHDVSQCTNIILACVSTNVIVFCSSNDLSGPYPLSSHIASTSDVTSLSRLHGAGQSRTIHQYIHGVHLSRAIHDNNKTARLSRVSHQYDTAHISVVYNYTQLNFVLPL